MRIYEVNSRYLKHQFISLPDQLNMDMPYWTIQPEAEIEHSFCEEMTALLSGGCAVRWVIVDKQLCPHGRIAAFYNAAENKGGFGFFECDNNQETANLLLDTAAKWLAAKGCRKMEGPLVLNEKERFWGLLTDGFNHPALYLENYNAPYYEKLLRNYGMQEHETVFTCRVMLRDVPVDRLQRIAEHVSTKKTIDLRKFSFDQLERFATDILFVYLNDPAVSYHWRKLSVKDIMELLLITKPSLVDDLIWIAYEADVPVGVMAFMRDLNQQIRLGFNGNSKRPVSLKGFLFSVVPGHRNFGVEVLLGDIFCRTLREKKENFELNFCGINKRNHRMISFLTTMNACITTTHKTFVINNVVSKLQG
jgi:hypothetical protein